VRGVSSVIVAVLITVIAASASIAAYFWVMPRISLSFDMGETQTVQTALESCDTKILETARTGSGNKCIFPSSRGTITAQYDGIYYSLKSKGRMCDPTLDWISIVPAKHIEFSCNVTSEGTTSYGLRWRYPQTLNITIENLDGSLSRYNELLTVNVTPPTELRTLNVFIYLIKEAGTAGKNIELNRRQLTSDNVTLGVRIY